MISAFFKIFAVISISAPFAFSAQGATHKIVIEAMKFTPETLTVHPHDQVIWINKDFFPHTATSDEADLSLNAAAPNKGHYDTQRTNSNGVVFDSQEIKVSGTWTYRPRKKGHILYHCKLHPTMKAILIVE